MPTQVVQEKKLTYQDYLETPEDQRYELIDGELIMTPAPIPKHQRVLRRIFIPLGVFVPNNDFGEVFCAPVDVYLDKYNCLQPDILFVSKKRLSLITEKNIQGAPDLVVEIVSENSAYKDLVQKKRLYEKFGVKEYWIVLPMEETIEVYILKNRQLQKWRSFQKKDELHSLVVKGFRLLLTEIF